MSGQVAGTAPCGFLAPTLLRLSAEAPHPATGTRGLPTAPCRDGLGTQCRAPGRTAPCCTGASGGAHGRVSNRKGWAAPPQGAQAGRGRPGTRLTARLLQGWHQDRGQR